MPRPRRSVVLLCIAAVALAAFLPGVPALDFVVCDAAWVLLPDLAYVLVPEAPAVPDEQPLSLRSLLPSRAPPAIA